jgi:serine/threonine-protein kinase
VTDLESQCPDARAAAEQLLQRQWLTAYQVEQLLSSEPRLVVGPYLLLEVIGEGGMGQVFKARHSLLQRVVALKLIHDDRLGRESEAVQRFEREARAAARLSHPHIVMIYDAGSAGSCYYIAMEHIIGADLARLVREGGPLPVAQACDYIRQAALGLQHAHEHGMVHRDIKPSNLLLTRATNLVKILDLGLARFDEADQTSTSLTREGVVIGTPDFIAPEQARNARKVDIRSDLYSLGASLYFLLTGEPPFPEGSAIEKLLKHQLDPPPLLHVIRPEIPRPVSTLVLKLLAKSPAERYQTPAELADALTALKENSTPSSVRVELPPAPAPRREPAPPPAMPPAPRIDTTPTPAPAPGQDTVDLSEGSRSGTSRRGGGLIATELVRLTGHLGAVVAVTFSHGRDTLASGGMDGSVRLWHFSQGAREALVLRKHLGTVSAIAFTNDDAVLATGSGSSDGQIWLGEVSGADPLDLAVLRGHAAPITALAFSSDHALLASASQDLTVRLWELGTQPRSRITLKGHSGPIRALAFSPDGARLASASSDGTVRLWDANRPRHPDLAVLPHSGGALAVCFSPDGELLAVGGGDGVVRLWDMTARKLVHPDSELTDHEGPIRQLRISDNSDRLVAVGESSLATVWFQGNELIQKWQLPPLTSPTFALTADGRYLANGGLDGVVTVYRISEKRGRGA